MEILIVLGLMVCCGLVLSPLYLIGRKKRARLVQEAKEKEPKMSRMKSALLLSVEAVLSIAFFIYLLLKEEIAIPQFVSFLVYTGLAIAIAMEINRRR